MHAWVSHPSSQEILYYHMWREVFTSSKLLNFTSVLNWKFGENNWIVCKHSFYFLSKIVTYSVPVKSMGTHKQK